MVKDSMQTSQDEGGWETGGFFLAGAMPMLNAVSQECFCSCASYWKFYSTLYLVLRHIHKLLVSVNCARQQDMYL